MKNNTNSIDIYFYLLLVILLAGAVLRLWDFGSMQFMHDELSALFRLQYDSLSDVIKYGVIEGDTHPAGVQVFLYYWTMIFGFSEIAVKLPFIFAGLVSIFVVYLIGRLWFDKITGIFTSVMLASTQYFVMFSQTARPYVTGLFLTLMMVYFWSLFFFRKRKNIYLVFYVVFSALSSYNHHFSLLFAAIVGFTGLFLIDRKSIIPYFLSGIAIFILYIPHLPIFFAQLDKGGIGYWLQKPEPTFLIEFIAYLLHYSIILISVLVVVILMLFSGSKVEIKNKISKRIILFVWFVIPILTGYLYSVLINPVVQYSMLIFSTPYFFILLFSFHRKVSQKLVTILVFALLLVSILTLVFQRKHYQIYYHQPYEELFNTALIENEDVTVIDDCVDYYHQYYFEKFGKQIPYITKKYLEDDYCKFDSAVSQIKTDYVVTHALSGEELQIVSKYFPVITDYKDGFTYEIYTFSVNHPEKENNFNKTIVYDSLDAVKGNWKDMSSKIVTDTNGIKYYYLENEEWGPSVEINFDSILILNGGIVDFSAKVKVENYDGKVLLVISVKNGDNEIISWRGIDIFKFCPENDKWSEVMLSSDLHGIILNEKYDKNAVLKANIWIPSKMPIAIKDLKVSIRPLNRNRYNLY